MENLKSDIALQEKKPLKLNYSQTAKVGLAFAVIVLFWSVYDFVVPLLLENAYGLSNTARGLVMGLDNLLALFMLPLFGKLSDKSKGKVTNRFGKRTPFILVGVILAALLMVFIPVSAKSQMVASDALRQEHLVEISENPTVLSERLEYFYGNSKYCDQNYLKQNNVSKEEYLSITYNHVSAKGFLKKTYYYNGLEVEKARYDELKAENANYDKFVSSGMKVWISEQVSDSVTSTDTGRSSLIGFMFILLFTLVAMATFRSPAVALMPDVTPKPLRSQANAIINLAGGIGSALAFIIYTVVLFQTNVNNYIIIFGAAAACMLILFALFMLLVKERKMVQECQEICKEYGLKDEDDVPAVAADVQENVAVQSVSEPSKKSLFDFYRNKTEREKAKFKSFLLILASIFMWFMGYNAVSTSMSIYCTKALNLDAGVASIVSGISMGVSAVAFIPVGFLAVKIGRRKSILAGFALATLSYILLFALVRPNANALVPAIFFSLFYLIAGFGLIIANVNTFPMVVELAGADEVGKYTGYYYTATMSAQAITPFLAGLVMDNIGMHYLFLYSTLCVVGAIALMCFVKHGDSKPIPKGQKLSKEEKQQIILDSMGDAD